MDLAPLLVRVEIVVLHPAPAVRADVGARGGERLRGGRVTLQRERACEGGQRKPALLEDPHHTPEADTAAVLEHRLGGEVAALPARISGRHFGQAALRNAVAVWYRRLGPFLVVHDEVDGDPRVSRPLRVWRICSLADQVTLVRLGHRGLSWLVDPRSDAMITRVTGRSVCPMATIGRVGYLCRRFTSGSVLNG